MLEEFLSGNSLFQLLSAEKKKLFPTEDESAVWASVKSDYTAEILSLAGKYSAIPYPSCLAEDYLAYVRTGSRKAYENPYFERRRKLVYAFLRHCLSKGDEEYAADDVNSMVNGIWLICEETAWAIPAHNGSDHPGQLPPEKRPLPDIQNPFVDLFAAQTAMILSIVCTVCASTLDGISPLIRQRVRLELERRIFLPFEKHDDFWWMGFIRKDLCNWTPWIVSNVMLSAYTWLEDRYRLSALLERGSRMIDRYLATLHDDGGCDEGAAYWNMAGGSLLDALELLDVITDGKMTFWENEKLKNILSFPLKAEIGNGWFVNFADCDARPFVSGERLITAGEKLRCPELISFGRRCATTVSQLINDVPHLWRVMQMIFHPDDAPVDIPVSAKDVWLPGIQVRVVERGGSILVCKGGCNGESHNHNDVGSFMLYRNGEPLVIDPGNMIYTAKTFSSARYTLWNVRSLYHNVPIIAGCEQQPGREFRAQDVQCTPAGLSLDISAAYPADAGILSARRSFTLHSNGSLEVRDHISLSAEGSVTYVFMLRHPPVLSDACISSGDLRIITSGRLSLRYEEIPVTDARMARSFPGSIYRVLCTCDPCSCHEETFIFERTGDA